MTPTVPSAPKMRAQDQFHGQAREGSTRRWRSPGFCRQRQNRISGVMRHEATSSRRTGATGTGCMIANSGVQSLCAISEASFTACRAHAYVVVPSSDLPAHAR